MTAAERFRKTAHILGAERQTEVRDVVSDGVAEAVGDRGDQLWGGNFSVLFAPRLFSRLFGSGSVDHSGDLAVGQTVLTRLRVSEILIERKESCI